jgi:hypothetical protein
VIYDVAFLLMNLWHRRLWHHTNRVWNRYFADTDDVDGASLLPLCLSCRAAVRAKTSATAAPLHAKGPNRSELERAAREYLSLAERLLHPPRPCMVAVTGFSGSGKSTLASQLAPALGGAPGAVVLSSDEVRNRLCGVPLLQRLGPDGYSEGVSQRVHSTLIEQASRLVRVGQSVIVDAVYARRPTAARRNRLPEWLRCHSPGSGSRRRRPSWWSAQANGGVIRPTRTLAWSGCSTRRIRVASLGVASTLQKPRLP